MVRLYSTWIGDRLVAPWPSDDNVFSIKVAPSGVRSTLKAATLLPTSDASRSPTLPVTIPAALIVFIFTLPDFHNGSPITTCGSSTGGGSDAGPGMFRVVLVEVVGVVRGVPS